jgi:hypothetical protein
MSARFWLGLSMVFYGWAVSGAGRFSRVCFQLAWLLRVLDVVLVLITPPPHTRKLSRLRTSRSTHRLRRARRSASLSVLPFP